MDISNHGSQPCTMLLSIVHKRQVKSSQVANFQIGTNKCANAKSPAQQKERTPQAARLLKPRLPGTPPVYGTGWANSLMG
jgi:hypothetical protein